MKTGNTTHPFTLSSRRGQPVVSVGLLFLSLALSGCQSFKQEYLGVNPKATVAEQRDYVQSVFAERLGSVTNVLSPQALDYFLNVVRSDYKLYLDREAIDQKINFYLVPGSLFENRMAIMDSVPRAGVLKEQKPLFETEKNKVVREVLFADGKQYAVALSKTALAQTEPGRRESVTTALALHELFHVVHMMLGEPFIDEAQMSFADYTKHEGRIYANQLYYFKVIQGQTFDQFMLDNYGGEWRKTVPERFCTFYQDSWNFIQARPAGDDQGPNPKDQLNPKAQPVRLSN